MDIKIFSQVLLDGLIKEGDFFDSEDIRKQVIRFLEDNGIKGYRYLGDGDKTRRSVELMNELVKFRLFSFQLDEAIFLKEGERPDTLEYSENQAFKKSARRIMDQISELFN